MYNIERGLLDVQIYFSHEFEHALLMCELFGALMVLSNFLPSPIRTWPEVAIFRYVVKHKKGGFHMLMR